MAAHEVQPHEEQEQHVHAGHVVQAPGMSIRRFPSRVRQTSCRPDVWCSTNAAVVSCIASPPPSTVLVSRTWMTSVTLAPGGSWMPNHFSFLFSAPLLSLRLSARTAPRSSAQMIISEDHESSTAPGGVHLLMICTNFPPKNRGRQPPSY
jgi:hypothetical protein